MGEREIYRNTVIKKRRESDEEGDKFNVKEKKKERERNRRTQRKKN